MLLPPFRRCLKLLEVHALRHSGADEDEVEFRARRSPRRRVGAAALHWRLRLPLPPALHLTGLLHRRECAHCLLPLLLRAAPRRAAHHEARQHAVCIFLLTITTTVIIITIIPGLLVRLCCRT